VNSLGLQLGCFFLCRSKYFLVGNPLSHCPQKGNLAFSPSGVLGGNVILQHFLGSKYQPTKVACPICGFRLMDPSEMIPLSLKSFEACCASGLTTLDGCIYNFMDELSTILQSGFGGGWRF